MPVVHTFPPIHSPIAQQQTIEPLEQADQFSTAHQPRLFSPLLGFTCTLLFVSFLTLSGCKKFDELIGARKTESSNSSSTSALLDDALFTGKSRAVWLRPNHQLSKRLHDQLKAEAYQAARKLIDKDVREKVKAEYPNDCHFGKFTFGYDVAWNYFSYSLEIVRTRKNGYRLVRVLCKTTWEIGWCKRKESGDLSMNISGSRIPYSIPNPALR
jgi:hypothetical protein